MTQPSLPRPTGRLRARLTFGCVALALGLPGSLVLSPAITAAQSIADGPVQVQLRVREIRTTGTSTDLAFFGVVGVPDEQTYFVRARDASDLDGADWTAGTGCVTHNFDPPTVTPDIGTVLFDHVYPSATPDRLQIAVDAWEDDAPDQLLGIACGGTRCSYDTGFCCGGFLFGSCLGAIDDDDLHCNAAPFADIDYRLGDACTIYDHGFVSSPVGGNCSLYQPRIETFWRYANGDTFAAPVELGALAELGTITHQNSTSTNCYSDTDAGSATPDMFAAVDVPASRSVRVRVCTAGAGPGIAVFDGGGTLLASSADGCMQPVELVACAGRLVVRVDAVSAAGETFTLTVSDLPGVSYPLAQCCGGGTPDRGEDCDDGNADDTDTCRNNCESARCGDGVIQAGVDTCDDGPLNGLPNQCNLTCTGNTPATCGNGAVEVGESCDDGANNGMPNSCAADCGGLTPAVCGNGVTEVGEPCDDGTATAACDADCSMVVCGDGTVNAAAGESCDDGVDNGTPTNCNSSCTGATPATCGNGAVESGEACDDAGESATCNSDCSTAACGDGVLNASASETCDDGADNGMPARCALDCSGVTASSCGNGVVEVGELCDTAGASATCDADCTMVVCGDAEVNSAAGELCDDGSDNGMPGRCAVDCAGRTAPRCGDGALDAGEACDEGSDNGTADGTCSSSCQLVLPARLSGGACALVPGSATPGWPLGLAGLVGVGFVWRRRRAR